MPRAEGCPDLHVYGRRVTGWCVKAPRGPAPAPSPRPAKAAHPGQNVG